METTPLRKKYGLSASVLVLLLIAVLILVGINVLLVLNNNFGASFYSYWLSGRILFAQGGNPYDPTLAAQVKSNYQLDPNVSGFNLPLYAMIAVLPFTFIDNFKAALILWMLILEAAACFTGVKLVQAFRLQNQLNLGVTVPAAILLNYYTFAAVLDGDIVILSLLFLIIALDAIREGENELAGIMLAFASIKYSVTLLPILWIGIWCLNHKKGTIAAWMAMVWALLMLIATLFMTDWFVEFLRATLYYFKYLNPSYLAGLIENWQPELGGRIGWAISGVLIVVLLIEWVFNAPRNYDAFEWVFAITLTLGFLIGIPNIGKNLFALAVPAVYSLNKMLLRWGKHTNIVLAGGILFFILIPWLFQLLVAVNWWDPVSYANVFLVGIVAGTLYWNRWWVIDTYVEPY